MLSYGYRQYQKTQMITASPGQLVVMLYQGAIRFLLKARAELNAGNLEGAHHSLVRAQDIVLELTTGLDLEAGPLAESLQSLYDFMYRRLVEANVRKDGQAIDDVIALLRELAEAWEAAVASIEGALPSEASQTGLQLATLHA